jgi:hypothetical protein
LRRICSLAFAELLLGAVLLLASAGLARGDAASRFLGRDDPDTVLEVISTARSRSFKPVGHSSVVLRMRTVARVTAAMKIRSHDVPDGYRNEIAAYRLSRMLGLDNVPPAVYRRVRWSEIRNRFHEDMLDRRRAVKRKVLWDDDASAPGAAVYWVRGMRSVGFEDVSKWADWVREGDIPKGKESLARDFSNMAVFDMLIGNWDRFSGGNFPADPTRRRALLRDNDRGFSTPLLEPRFQRLLERLSATERFSRTTVRTLGALDADAIRRALSDGLGDDMGPLLSERQVADVLERRATILSHVAALVDERGEADVLVFP